MKINEIKSWVFLKRSRLIIFLARLTKKKREGTQIMKLKIDEENAFDKI